MSNASSSLLQDSYQIKQAAHLSSILAGLPKNASATLKTFVAQFYEKTPLDDLKQYDVKRAVGLAESALGFMESREPGVPKIRIFTPQKNQHGYEGKYTVIELLNDDMPFLVDSLTSELTRQGFTIRETIHPIFKVKRDKKGTLQELGAQGVKAQDWALESFIHFEISGFSDALAEQFEADLQWVLQHIRSTVEDWREIMEKADCLAKSLKEVHGHFSGEEVAEAQHFLGWLADRNFVFMGYAEYDFFDSKGKEKLSVVPGSPLGILKINDDINAQGIEALPPEVRHFLLVPQIVEITKSNRRSLVHRGVLMDYIAVKRFDAKGNVIGEARLLGLFTSNVYYQSASQIPLVRSKIEAVLTRTQFSPSSHDGKALKAILEFLPRDELFQMSEDTLFETSLGILQLEAKPSVRLFARRDAFERFVSLMVFIPRERFSTELRQQIQQVVEQAFNGVTSSFSTQIAEVPLARLHLIVRTTPGDIPTVDISKIEQEIARRAYLWSDLLYEALLEKHGEQKADLLQKLYGSAFSNAYIDSYNSQEAVYDIGKIQESVESTELSLELFRDKKQPEKFIRLKIYNPGEQIALSDFLPMLENAGFRVIEELPFQVKLQSEKQVWLHDFKLEIAGDYTIDLENTKPLVEEALLKTWQREMENDRFNMLVLRAHLNWRQVICVRAYAKYLKQIGFTYSQAAIEQALAQQPGIVRSIVALFEARFDMVKKDRDSRVAELLAKIEEQLAQVSDAAGDRILRRYTEIILATLRTNYYQVSKDGDYKPVLSFKFDSKRVPELPLPRPFAEIFVYGTRVEGIHLRGGRVARGGLRWSDRHEDFRTEVLGLMKAQMVKNSVIVPVGSKGGFVVKQPPQNGSREAYMEEGIACYKMYLSGLLDITDNIAAGGKIVAPEQVTRHDDDDPYLVVAADKGTATFSDIANSVSAAYGFWLGDAFASGGSVGYDHKAMAITARGAWVSVTRHFSEMGVDIAKEDFTCVGIGDMAGDVFGNGMLLSDHIRLVAAFNHMHIFIDPTPDAKASFAERKRLFSLPRSSWKDYKPELISKGGGIFERSVKSITLSKEAREALCIEKAGAMTPDELIHAILLSPVDLLWNGGIGTYVKAEEETNEQVGDRANNAVRVNGKELRAKIIGEGGNLGFTQKGRIEYARSGGRINTDAIDNSAGVDCSDHEVNIKIAFSSEVARGKLTTAQRDKQLESMTDDVAKLVLKDNILQTQALTITEQQGFRLLESQARLMHMLERHGLLDRAIEYLPTDKQLSELKVAKKGLTRPELAVLLSYSKMYIYNEILSSTLPDEPYFTGDLNRYFPPVMQKNFAEAITSHQLRREIIATVVTNSIVNRAGITFFSGISEDLGVSARDIAAAYTLARDAFDLRGLWKDIEEATGVHVSVCAQMYAAASEFLERVTGWLLRNLPLPLDINKVSGEIVPGIAEIEKNKAKLYSDVARSAYDVRIAAMVEKGVPEKLAMRVAGLELLGSSLDIISVGHQTKLPLTMVGKLYFELDDRLSLGWLRLSAGNITAQSHWERLAVQAIIGDLYDEQRRLTAQIIAKTCKDGDCSGSMEVWSQANSEDLVRFERFMDDMKAGDTPDIARLMVALRHIRSL